MKRFVFFSILLLVGWVIPAQLYAVNAEDSGKGSLRGRISDVSKQTLPGATVYIDELKNGVVSDVNGYYIFQKIPAGRYRVKVSYVGYTPEEFEVNIKGETVTEKNVTLKSDVQQLQEVEVSGTFKGYQRAMNFQKNSIELRNVVSADQVGRFPDANVGDALKRISGINVQYDQGEARFGQVRGTSPDLSSVTINGNRIPSAEGDARNVQLDLIPADMIQTIVVNKVVTADMDADAIGGSVNLVTKSSPSKRIIGATIGTGWNFISDRMQANAALSYGDNFLKNKLGLMLSASYQNNPAGSDNTEFVWEQNDEGKLYVSDYQVRQYFVQRERQSYSASLNYQFNLSHRLDFKAIFNTRKDWENRYRMTLKDINEDGLAKSVRFQTKGGTADNKSARLEKQQTMDFALGGEHLFKTTLFNWNASYAKATEERPNERYIAYEKKKQQFTLDLSDMEKPMMTPKDASSVQLGEGFGLQELTEQQGDVKERDFKGSFNFNVPVLFGSSVANLKFGAKIGAKKKSRDNQFYDYAPVDEEAFDRNSFANLKDQTRSDFYAGDYKAGTYVDKKYLGHLDLNNAKLFEKEENIEEIASNFDAKETVTAGYVRYDQKLGRRWDAMVGLRLENTHLKYNGMRLEIDEEGDPAGLERTPDYKDNYINVLPSVLVKFDATDAVKLRASYTNTIARPKYYDLVPHVSINFEDMEVALGNPELKATLSHNVDFGGDYYFPAFGMISAGVYYKKINDFIVTQRLANAEYNGRVYNKLFKPINAGNANLVGVELGWQRDFGFIAPALKYLGFYANYTYTHSAVNDFNIEGRENEKDLSMPGSPEHIANASLYFERKGLNLRLSYNFASAFVDEFGETAFDDRYYDKVNYLDINASYTFAKHYTFFAEANNLLNQPLRYYQGVSSRTAQAEYYGVKLNAGFKINF